MKIKMKTIENFILKLNLNEFNIVNSILVISGVILSIMGYWFSMAILITSLILSIFSYILGFIQLRISYDNLEEYTEELERYIIDSIGKNKKEGA